MPDEAPGRMDDRKGSRQEPPLSPQQISRVGEFKLIWGESLCWDDRRQRLYLVDCATQTLHWLEGAEPPLCSLAMPSMPTGVVLAEDGRLVVALDDGLHIVDADAARTSLLTPYPPGLGERANDAAADLDGNLVTGTLNLVPGPGSYWWYSSSAGWRQLDEGIGNANGPVVAALDGEPTLVFADTMASRLYAYAYDGTQGRVRRRRIFADTAELGGQPDGACADADGGIWSCLVRAGKIVRYTAHGATEVVDATVELPSDVTFGGAALDRMFFVSIAVSVGDIEITSPNTGGLMVIDDSGYRGRPEPRFRLLP
jgi:sugar lactone lactonase YvrE